MRESVDNKAYDYFSIYPTGATSEYNGDSNMKIVMSHSWLWHHLGTSSVKLAYDYTGGGFTDWYLPSVTELNHAFNAGQIVDSVLGTNGLTGSYWTSTEINKDQAYSYDFNNQNDKKSGINVSRKDNLFKVRPFRLAQVYDNVRRWREEWDIEYTPIWGGPYAWDEFNWRFTTSITIDTNPIISYKATSLYDNGTTMIIQGTGSYGATFSNVVTTFETIINTGVCWATSSTTPTIANSFTYSQSGGPTNFVAKTPTIFGQPVGTSWPNGTNVPFITYFRSFVTTPSGIYYSSNTGKNVTNATYSVGTTYAYFPTGCYTILNTQRSLYE